MYDMYGEPPYFNTDMVKALILQSLSILIQDLYLHSRFFRFLVKNYKNHSIQFTLSTLLACVMHSTNTT